MLDNNARAGGRCSRVTLVSGTLPAALCCSAVSRHQSTTSTKDRAVSEEEHCSPGDRGCPDPSSHALRVLLKTSRLGDRILASVPRLLLRFHVLVLVVNHDFVLANTSLDRALHSHDVQVSQRH